MNARSVTVSIFITSFALMPLLTPPALVQADDVPVLDVAGLCHGIASQSSDPMSSNYTKVSFDECMKAEHEDREQLAKEWSTFSAADKTHCTAEAKMGGESSYTELMTCLEMARDVRALNNPKSGDQK